MDKFANIQKQEKQEKQKERKEEQEKFNEIKWLTAC